METERTPRFWELVRMVVAAAHGSGLVVPGFRSPPRVKGAVRTLRRHPGGGLVSVAWRGRPSAAVLTDLVDGVVVVNGLVGAEAAACRRRLWAALGSEGAGLAAVPAGEAAATAAPATEARVA